MKTIQVRAFAKINVGLKILGKRPDGYHEIRTVYQTVGLADRLQAGLSPRRKGIRLECDCAELSTGRDNLVYRAAELWRRARGFKGGITLRLEKKIPMGAGLGGGSSDAAATLLALERLPETAWNLRPACRWPRSSALTFLCFCREGACWAAAAARRFIPLTDLPARPCLIAFPGFSVSTAEAYGVLGLRLTGRPKAVK